jgi:hypothetical protein
MRKFLMLFMLVAAPVYAQDSGMNFRTTAGCGPTQTKFDVKAGKTENASQQNPAPGKALVYVFEEYRTDQGQVIGHLTSRVGLDGSWIGATHEGLYMSFPVDPGIRHLCSDVQSSVPGTGKLNAAGDLNAEAGKVYFYQVTVKPETGKPITFQLASIDAAEGALLASESKPSSSQVKK